METSEAAKRAIELAAAAMAHGNHPFGALLLSSKGTVLVESENTVNTEQDPTAHAEMNVLRGLAKLKQRLAAQEKNASTSAAATSEEKLDVVTCILVTSTEPCMMCSGAMYWAGIRHVIYCCSELSLAKYAGDDFLCPCRDTFKKGQQPVTVEGPVLEEEGEALHRQYWPALFAGTLHTEISA
jgi:tRNA(Arg) A34 adenosine deaminase TadA